MSTHKDAYGIPHNHTLKQTRYKARGTVAENEDWTHEELDEQGNLVARYESWHHTDVRNGGATSTGFRKFGPDGTLIHTSDTLFK